MASIIAGVSVTILIEKKKKATSISIPLNNQKFIPKKQQKSNKHFI